MNSTQISCFLSAAETLNFTKSAEALHFLPQTVSKNIRGMEQELGLLLFQRSNNNLTLTEAGQYYQQLLSHVAAGTKAAIERARMVSDQQARHLRIIYSELINPLDELTSVVGQFRLLYPGIRVSGGQGNTISCLQQNKADVAVLLTNAPVVENEFHTSLITPTAERLYVSPLVEIRDGDSKIDPKCWGVPVIQNFTTISSPLEYLYHASKKLEYYGLEPCKVELLPNPQSVAATLQCCPSATISFSRFGFIGSTKCLRSFDLPEAPHPYWLSCVWSRTSENPMIAPFVELMQRELG